MTYEDLWKQQAGGFLCNIPPEDFLDWEDEDRYEWIEENSWQPFEYWDGYQVHQIIDEHAQSTWEFLKHHGLVETNETA